MYQDIKIDRYKLMDNVKNNFDSEVDFDAIDNYKNDIEKYIYTNIQMTDGSESIEKAFQSRLQILISSVLLRSLLLKSGIVTALNNNNFPTYYATSKSFLEIPALLGYIAYLIYNDNDYKTIIPKINTLYLGNKEAGSLFVGKTEAINILTMFDKLGKIIKGIASDGKTDEEKKEILEKEDVLTSTYKDVCNFAHINYNAHLSVGILEKSGLWKGKRDASGYKKELYAFYMPPFNIAIDTINMLCGFILRNQKVNNFNLLNSDHYFKE